MNEELQKADINLFKNRNFDKKIIRYEKYSNGEWVKTDEIDPNLGYFFIVDGKPVRIFNLDYLYFTYFDLNTDFESKTCGACFQIE